MRRPGGFDLFQLCVLALGHSIAVPVYLVSLGGESGFRDAAFVFFVSLAFFSGVYQVFTRRRSEYLGALATSCAACLALVPVVSEVRALELLIFPGLLIGICLYNPFPVNTAVGSLATLAIAVLRLTHLESIGVPVGELTLRTAEFVVGSGLLIAFATGMVVYRERLIDQQHENIRLDSLVERLTRTNLNYQEYARAVEEQSIETERKRITRDIHDIVGYTLTNNITMMEAVTDMMRVNPLGVATIVKLARENAEDGLARIRDALHLLRSSEVSQPTGLRAVQRLAHVFSLATGVKVVFSYHEIPWDFSPDVDSAFYHVLQESFMNAFRHGRATEVDVFLTREAGILELKVCDNGEGAKQLVEDIGISGMRERVEKLGGVLRAAAVVGGFEVCARLPWPGGGAPT